MKVTRGNYGEIQMQSLGERARKMVRNLLKEVCNSEKVDEHGWKFGAEFDKKGRGYATNWDLYGVGKDYHNSRFLMVIQVRQWHKRTRNGYPNVRKSYFLCGRNEDNTAFAHPVESRVIHHAIKIGGDVVRACQNWIFGTDYRNILRQGDVALIPVRSALKDVCPVGDEVLIEGSHYLKGALYANNTLYVENPELIHLPGTHPNYHETGLYKVMVSKRGRFHDFAAPTID